ncbi:MAG: hypothetical protein LBL33_10730 [Tannerella sp.]|jgi:hypothetical protein|nr:hypothetical protein [Tannerella sp.]
MKKDELKKETLQNEEALGELDSTEVNGGRQVGRADENSEMNIYCPPAKSHSEVKGERQIGRADDDILNLYCPKKSFSEVRGERQGERLTDNNIYCPKI